MEGLLTMVKLLYNPLYPIWRSAITLYPIGKSVKATITLYPIGRPVRATITLYPIGRPIIIPDRTFDTMALQHMITLELL